MKAFQNNSALKSLCLELTQRSPLLEQFSGSTIFEKFPAVRFDIVRLENFQECLVLEEQLGIPAVVFSLASIIAKELPPQDAKTWSNNLYASIRVGANLSCVWPRFAAWILSELKAGAAATANSEEVTAAIDNLSRLCRTLTSAPEEKTAVFDTIQKYFDDKSVTSFEIIRSIYWSFTAKNYAQQSSNAGDALNQLAFVRYSQSQSYKGYSSLRTGAYVKQAAQFLTFLRSA